MRITWEVEDGYCGKSRPHEIIVPDDELAECGTDQERKELLIEEYVQTDFDNKVSWTITSREGMS